MSNNNQTLLLKIFPGLVMIESGWALYSLASLPSEAKTSLLLGFSASRLALLGCILLVLVISLMFLFRGFASRSGLGDWVRVTHAFLSNEKKRRLLISTCWLIVLAGTVFLLTPPERTGGAIYQRMIPLTVLAMSIAAETLIFLFLWLEKKIYWNELGKWRTPLVISAGVLFFLLLLWAGIAWSGIGIKREPSGWLSQGTPLLPQQLLFAWSIGLAFIFWGQKIKLYKKTDLVIILLLWVTASLIWWREPMLRASYFTPLPTPPNFEYYPYSDAALYDKFAQDMLIGTSRHTGVTHRPLYSIFLALLHTIGGHGFQNILPMQVFILAFIPAAGYMLASRIGGRAVGIITALLFIFREQNSIALTNIIEVSHVKLLMSDVPAMLLMILFIHFYVKWLQDRGNKLVLGTLAGACLGLSIFIRSQAMLLVPIALLGLILTPAFTWKTFLQKSCVFLLGVAVVIAPWVWRNYQVSGKAVVEYQEFYTEFIASSYSSSPGDIDRLPSETDKQYDARMKDQIINFILDNPLEVARFYSSYFLHNEVTSVAYLPMSLQFNNIYEYVKSYDFWDAPYLGEMPARTFPALFVILFVMAVGIGTTIHRWRWIGVFPILFHLGYSFSVVPVKQSGWRFILPVDWVTILYFSLGLVQLSTLVISLFSEKNEDPLSQDGKSPTTIINWKWVVPTMTAFALFGISLPLIEWNIPERYPKLDGNELIQTYVPEEFLLKNGERITASALKSFLETEPSAMVAHGRALYPSYYEEGTFWGESSPNLLVASQFNRLQFMLIGPNQGFFFIPLVDAPQYFPHAADIFVVGCRQDGFFRALLVKVNDHFLVSSPWGGLTCSKTE